MKSLTSRRFLSFFLLNLSIIAFVQITGYSQDLDNVTISGRVSDQNGGSIPGASIEVVQTKTGFSRASVSDSAGRFRLSQLPTGEYTLKVSCLGFATQEMQNLSTLAGEHLQLELTLYPPEIITEAVTITTDEPSIDTTRTVVGGTLTSEEIDTLPFFSRSPLDLIFLLGGVTEEPLSTRDLAEDRNTNPNTTPEEAGVFALSGGPAYSNNITIDGLDNNDDRAARERFQPSLEAIEEVQVITNQFSAEYGRASGGRVNFRTRGGSKQFRGRAYFFFRDEALNANTFRNNSTGLKRLPFQEHNPGITFSGPLRFPGVRTQTVFFTSYEYTTVLDKALIDTLVPVQQNPHFPLPQPTTLSRSRLEKVSEPALASEIAPYLAPVNTPSRNHRLTTRIDHRFTDMHNGAFVFQMGRLENLRQFGGGNRLMDALQANARQSDAISYSDTWVISQTLVNQSRFQLSQLSPAVKARDSSNPVVLIAINDPLDAADGDRRSGTLIAGASSIGATHRSESRFQFQNVLDYSRATKTLRVGFDAQRIRSTFINLADVSGTFNFASAGDFLAGIPSRFRQNFGTESSQRNTYISVYFQNEWRLRQNLTLSYGVRYENESILRDRNNFAPRFSVAYDPFNSGKTVIRFGAGIFYNRALLRTIDDFTLGTQQRFFDTNALRDPTTDRLFNAEQRRIFIAENLKFPNTLTEDSSLVRNFGFLNMGFSRRLDPNLRIPESYQANLGVERDLGHGFLLAANYTFNRGIHLWREFNVNAPVLPTGFNSFTDYLISRDFFNFRRGPTGLRPLYNASAAGEVVRFVLNPADPENPNLIGRKIEFGIPVSLVNLNSLSSTTVVDIARAALNDLRPDPTRAEVEQLIAAGNSFYKGLTVELRKSGRGKALRFSLRAAYTLSYLVDDGIVNTSDALRPGDFRGERARSLLDRRHRFVVSGMMESPRYLKGLRFSPILRLASGAPFNISIGGADRNLDDVGNDRPIYTGDPKLLVWRQPGEPLSPAVLDFFKLPAIGESGNLPRNAGQGPGLFRFDLSITKQFSFKERFVLRPTIQFDNVLNKTVFSFGTEFINFNALGPTASPEQRQAFLDSFLVTTRTLRPRQLRLGLRLDF